MWGVWLINSTIQNTVFVETEPKLLTRFEQNGSRIKRFREPESSDVNEALFKWFKQQRSDNVPVSSPFVKINFVLLDGQRERDM